MGIFFSTEEEKRWWTELQNYKIKGADLCAGVGCWWGVGGGGLR